MTLSFPITYRYIARNRKQLVCTLHEDAISFTVQSKDRMVKSYHYNYSDIDCIHLSLSDVSWHTIDIYFKDKTHIHLKSVLFFTEKQGGKLRRLKSNEEDNELVRERQRAYNTFVIALHERLNLYESHKGIKFTHGNPWNKVLVGSILIALILAIPIAWQLDNYRLVFVWMVSFILLLLFNRKINFRKNYSSKAIPQKYLPRLYYRLFAIGLLACSSLLTSCFGPKNLVTNQSGVPQYDFMGDTVNGWALVRQDSLWGFVSADGRKVIKPSFLWATDFTDGMALAEDKRGYRYINRQGKLLRRVKVPHAYSFSEGLAPIQIKDKWGYINRKGKIEIKPQFDWAMPFHENRAEVSVGLRKGYINKSGQLIIPANYEEASPFKNGIAMVRKDFQYGLIDTLGDFVLFNHFDEIKPWGSKFYRLGVIDPTIGRVSKFGLADAHGKLLLDTLYAAVDLLKKRYIRVEKENLYGLYDEQGKEIISMEYTHLDPIPETNFLNAQKDGLWAFLDLQGRPLLPFDDQLFISAYEGRIWIARDSLSILMDDQFREIKRFSTYNRVFPFSNGFAPVSVQDTSVYKGNLYGYIDREGNEVIPPQFDGGVGYVNAYGISVVGKKSYGMIRDHLFDLKTGLLVNEEGYTNLKRFGPLFFTDYGDFLSQKSGFEIPDFPYLSIQPLRDRRDLAVVRQEGKVGLIDTSLTELLPVEFESINNIYHGRMQVKKDGKWGFVDEKFRIRIPMKYEDAYYFRYPMLTEVTQNKKKGVIDRYGREIIPMRYDYIYFDTVSDRIYAEKSDGIDIFDQNGRLLYVSDFEYLGFYGRKAFVAYRQNGKTGFMDYDFNILVNPTYDRVGSFYNALAFVVLNDKGGYINERLELVVPLEFEQWDNFALGIAKVKKDGREYYINTQGQEVTPTEDELEKRDEEIERRKSGWIDFSS